MPSKPLQNGVRLCQVLRVRPLSLDEIRHGVQPHAIDAELEPEVENGLNCFEDCRIVEVQVRLVRVEAVPVVRLRNRIPRPVRSLEVLEDDSRALIALRRLAPDVELAFGITSRSRARPLEPGVLIGCVIDDELGDDAESPAVRVIEKAAAVLERAVRRMDVRIVGDVVAIVAQRRRVERQQPHCGDAEVLQVSEPRREAREVADPVSIAVLERPDVQLIDDRVLVPFRVGRHGNC